MDIWHRSRKGRRLTVFSLFYPYGHFQGEWCPRMRQFKVFMFNKKAIWLSRAITKQRQIGILLRNFRSHSEIEKTYFHTSYPYVENASWLRWCEQLTRWNCCTFAVIHENIDIVFVSNAIFFVLSFPLWMSIAFDG